MKFASLIIGIIISAGMIKAQQADSLQLAGREIIGMRIGHLAELSEAGIDLGEITEDLEYYLEYPLNLNDADRNDLQKLGFLSDIQIKNLIDYRKKYGSFLSIYELKVIDGLGRNTLEKIKPFVVVEAVDTYNFKAKSLLRGKHELLVRFQRKLVPSEGYLNAALASEKPGSVYLGDPNRYYIRYRYQAANKIKIGFLAEKDPGEPFLNIPGNLSDSIRKMLPPPQGFDFYSLYASYEGKKALKCIIVGDYHARFGQGLVLWSGLSFSGGQDPASVKRYAPGIRPNSSVNENMFFRGAAVTIRWKGIEMSTIFSMNKVDANFTLDSNLNNIATSMPATGYHRTLNELEDKNKMSILNLGGHISWRNDHLQIGAGICQSNYSHLIQPEDKPSNIYRFSGLNNLVAGLDFDILLRRTNIFGEIAASQNGGWALLSGVIHTTDNGSIFAVLLREYKAQYQNLMAQATGKRDMNANEKGIRVSMDLPLFRRLSFLASYDHYSFPRITSRNINIQRGQDYYLKLLYSSWSALEFSFRYKYSSGTQNSNLQTWFNQAVRAEKHDLQIKARYKVSANYSMKIQAGYNIFRASKESVRSVGSMLLLDMYYHPESVPLKLTFRYALFHTDDYNSRLYAYENDVLYSSSMPAYYGKGFRFYLLMKYSPAHWLNMWFRFSMTCFTDRNSISSGPETIEGNKLPEIKIQLRMKL